MPLHAYEQATTSPRGHDLEEDWWRRQEWPLRLTESDRRRDNLRSESPGPVSSLTRGKTVRANNKVAYLMPTPTAMRKRKTTAPTSSRGDRVTITWWNIDKTISVRSSTSSTSTVWALRTNSWRSSVLSLILAHQNVILWREDCRSLIICRRRQLIVILKE